MPELPGPAGLDDVDESTDDEGPAGVTPEQLTEATTEWAFG
jgi:hypothetical protein